MYEFPVNDRILKINTCPGMFSPAHADAGTLSMLSFAGEENMTKVLDLGCGAGIVGMYYAVLGAESVTMTDIDEESVKFACENLKANLTESELKIVQCFASDAFEKIHDTDYTLILSNVPYHTDFSVAKRFIEGAFSHLAVGGKMFIVAKRADWYRNKMISVFGGVRVFEKDGYYVFSSEKRSETRPDKTKKKKKTVSSKIERKIKKMSNKIHKKSY